MDRSSGLLWSAIAAVSAVLLVGAYFGTKLTLETQPASASAHRLQSSGKWDRYVAPDDYCPGKNDLGAPLASLKSHPGGESVDGAAGVPSKGRPTLVGEGQ